MKYATTRKSLATTLALFLLLLTAATAFAQSTAFTQQGRLTDNGAAANGLYDLQFALFDAVSGGTQQGATLTRDDVVVTNSVFTVALDFGNTPFATGAARWLQISVRTGNSTGAYTTLTPRQPISATPYAIRSQNAATADGLSANCVGCITATQIQNGGSFIQNTTTPQASANFNISGDGTAGGTLSAATVSGGTVNAGNQFNLNSARFLSGAGNSNIFAGGGAGATNAGGAFNAFFGARAGLNNLTGSGNVFLGNDTGLNNSSGNSNTLIGSGASLAADGLSFATAIGSLATVATSNTLVLGRSADTVHIPGLINAATQYNLGGNRVLAVSGSAGVDPNSNTFVGVGAGANTTPDANSTAGNTNSFFGNQAGFSNTTGLQNAFYGRFAGLSNTSGGGNSFFGGDETGQANTTGSLNSFFGEGAGTSNTTGNRNVIIGAIAGNLNTTGSNNTLLGTGANVGSNGLSYATAIGAEAVVATNNTIVLGRSDGSDKVRIPGLGAAGSTQLCRNANNEISTCSSSLRYKTDLAPYRHGLDFIQRLQPISFTWKDGGLRDLGFGAEDIAKIDPLLVIYNKEGQVEGVKYDRLSALLVNAVKEQQAQLAAQQKQLETLHADRQEQQHQIEELKAQLAALVAQLPQPKTAGQR